MSNITNEIESAGVYFKQPEPTNANYSMFNTGGVECEVGEFLYGLVRMIKPEKVLETGTHRGVGAAYIGSALRDNNMGHLTTLEFIPELHEESQFNIDRMGTISNYITCLLGDVTTFETKEQYDFIFLDTEPQLRFAELLRFWNNLKPGGIVIIHDLGTVMGQTNVIMNGELNWPWGTIPEEMNKLFKTHQLQSLHFNTPRGIYIGQKVRDDFYSTKHL